MLNCYIDSELKTLQWESQTYEYKVVSYMLVSFMFVSYNICS